MATLGYDTEPSDPRPRPRPTGSDYSTYKPPAVQPSSTPVTFPQQESHTSVYPSGAWNDWPIPQPETGGINGGGLYGGTPSWWNGSAAQPPPLQNQPQQQSPYQMNQNFQYGGNISGTPYSQMGQYTNQLEGFDSGKLNDPTHNSAKYMFARVASRYAPTQQGFAQLMADPDFQRLGMQSVGNGKIRLSNGDIIDVVRGFQSGGHAWQWGAETVNGQAPQAAPAAAQQPAWSGQQPAWGYNPMQAWQHYYQQLAAWQAAQQAQAFNPLPQTPMPTTTQPVPAQAPPQTGYYQPPQAVQAAPGYGGAGYGQAVGLQAGQAPAYTDPVQLTLQQLGYGMPVPYYYG